MVSDAQAEIGDLLFTINNPSPGINDYFGFTVATTTNGNIVIGTNSDDTSDVNNGSVYVYEGQ